MPKADFEKVLAVNTTGVWLCCREAAKYMVKQNHGSLINTSSDSYRGTTPPAKWACGITRLENELAVEYHRQRLLPRHH
jgi:NAD(P)-dependent dehydrogenase (short-subunit alcohol dehydrogenase family)